MNTKDKTNVGTCGNCQRWKELGKSRSGMCPHSDKLLGADKAGCYNHALKVEKPKRKAAHAGEQERMGV